MLEYASDELISNKREAQPAPAVIDTPALQTNFAPALAFDQSGNLWQSGGLTQAGFLIHPLDALFEYTEAQLAAGTQTEPYQTLLVADTTNVSALNAPSSITFDANGNLWVAFALGGTGNAGGLEMFAAADLTGEGTVTPLPQITIASAPYNWGKVELPSFANPDGLAFDSQGDLWVANVSKESSKLGFGSLVEFPPDALSASGSPVPVRGILANKKDTNLGGPIYITFGPTLP